jgi:ribosomal biogenesis protein LAS1
MVNGIADSQQKGRVAISVNHLAESAGLSRLLVDVRHEATHNELPSLSTLQLAARQALDWLVQQYWWVRMGLLALGRGPVQQPVSLLLSC